MTFSESISIFMPSRMTFALGEDKDFRLSSDFSALTCWAVPRIAFMMMTAKITMVLSILPENMDMIAAAMRISTSRSANWLRNT